MSDYEDLTLVRPRAERNQAATITTKYPTRIALEFVPHQRGSAGQTWTYERLIRAITDRAQKLVQQQVKRGSRVGILGANSPQWIVDFYALQLLGAVVVPLSYKYPPAALAHVLADSQTTLVLVEERYAALLKAGIAALGESSRNADAPPTTAPLGEALDEGNASGTNSGLEDVTVKYLTRPAADDLAMVLYTSGSTGNPKGVALNHASHVWVMDTAAKSRAEEFGVLVAAPLYHMNALARTQKALAAGETIVLLAEFDGTTFAEAIEQRVIHELTGVPPMFALLGQHLELVSLAARERVRHVNMASAPAGDALFAAMAQAFPNARVTIGYGTTESGPVAFVASENPVTPVGSVGQPHPSVATRLVDPETGANSQVFGVLQIRTGALLSEYLNHPKSALPLTSDGFYHTKDLFRVIDGNFYFAGREDDMFNSGAENVYPAAVEAVLLTHPAIKEAVVVPVPDHVKTWKPVAFVTLNSDVPEPTETELKTFTLDYLEPYAHPRRIRVLPVMPLAPTNKIDRKQLQEQGTALGPLG